MACTFKMKTEKQSIPNTVQWECVYFDLQSKKRGIQPPLYKYMHRRDSWPWFQPSSMQSAHPQEEHQAVASGDQCCHPDPWMQGTEFWGPAEPSMWLFLSALFSSALTSWQCCHFRSCSLYTYLEQSQQHPAYNWVYLSSYSGESATLDR